MQSNQQPQRRGPAVLQLFVSLVTGVLQRDSNKCWKRSFHFANESASPSVPQKQENKRRPGFIKTLKQESHFSVGSGSLRHDSNR